MRNLLVAIIVFTSCISSAFAQANVGIGTATPHPRAILDLTSTNQVFLPPRMTSTQMEAISAPPLGSLIYNSDVKQLMAYTNTHDNFILIGGILRRISFNAWLPISAGPKILAWGVMDSTTGNENTTEGALAPMKSGSGNFSIRWYGTQNSKKWYELTLTNENFDADSMILVITPWGNGSWDVAPSVGEIIDGSTTRASIKFTDISRSVAGWSSLDIRRRSKFYFVLYDLRGY